MPHSFINIWVHATWATKHRAPFILPQAEKQIYDFITRQFESFKCPARIVNGMPDHIHCLFLLNRQSSIAEIVKQVKGSSSHFINDQKLLPEMFAWQTGYAAFSVSEGNLKNVYYYIKNQKAHHSKINYEDELVSLK